MKKDGAPVFAKEIDRKPAWRGHDLICWEKDCGSNVREVEGYVKRDGTPCGAYFRLKKNEKHAPGCPWNPAGT
ncbi:hypothetical protein [Streptomyces sp. BH055]|uniref:hypothetical protein n=1 Tax=Streptomyces sp. BH055 TaxID=3401173 RepID=UPI003BB57B04